MLGQKIKEVGLPQSPLQKIARPMRPIPKKLKDDLAADPFYKRCCITGWVLEKIEWHHNFIFAGRQVNEKWCILPLAESVHKNIVRYKEKCNWIMLNRADEATLRKYSKSTDLIFKRDSLNKKYGTYPQRMI